PRKNHVGVLEAFARLEPRVRDAFQIVFAGSNFNDLGRLANTIQANDLPQSVLSVAVHPTDEDLQVLYKLAHLGIFPSLYEGFGLGILESMAFGLPVIASNTSAMPEVMGREDALFDPSDADDMAAKISQGLTDEAFRADLARYGLAHIEKWDWAICGQRAVAACAKVHANAGKQHPADGFSARKWAIERISALPIPDMGAADQQAMLANVATAIELTYPTVLPAQRPRIFIDVSEFVHYDYNTGIQRVIKCIVSEMARQLEGVALALVYSHADGIGYHYARNLQDHLLNGKSRRPFDQESTERVAFAEGDILFHSELTMPQVVRQRFHLQTLREIGVKIVFLVYDLIPINYSFHEGHHVKAAMLNWLSCLLQGDKLISISRATRDDVRVCIAEYDLPFQPMVELDWFHLGGDFRNYILQETVRPGATSQVLETFREAEIAGLRGKINFLMVGTIEPRKSHADMLRAMEVLWAKGVDVNLVIVGKVGWLDEKQMAYIKQHPELGRRFFLFNDLSDVQLDEIYRLSTCLLYFSKVEGFGLPLIEAAQHGVPIIVRDAPVFREVCGEHAFYFPDGLSPVEVAPYIERWLALFEKDEHPTSGAMPWLTWQESVRDLISKVFAAPDPTKRLPESREALRTDVEGEVGYVR
ncbi:glycosyltransferase, partial [Brevundimonas sp.]|uniref:glycosyltransferase n=1 Tax=Brevundimonas sp. TaxID=1871086 RepID=UPI0025B9D869